VYDDLRRIAHRRLQSERTDITLDTTAAEAGKIKEHVRAILEVVPQAAHWSMVSEIYHQSSEARKAFEGSIKVLEQGNHLYAESGRFHMDGLQSVRLVPSTQAAIAPVVR
jgi:hypothetical protein